MNTVVSVIAVLGLLLNLSFFLRLKPPYNFQVALMPQLAAATLSPILLVAGLLLAALGGLWNAPVALIAGLLCAAISAYYILGVLSVRADFARAFGKDWRKKIPPERYARLIRRRWGLGFPRVDEPRWERNVPFWKIPGTERELLCDLWQPPDGVARTGLALVYCHGSAWYMLDKDMGTRPFFRQLAAQGHVVMDVAYRLCPEVDMLGMVGDVKRAVAWMKANAERYQVRADGVVLMGGSAGAHLALLAAYTPTEPRLTPDELREADLSVRAVVSYYGPTDLRAHYDSTGQARNEKKHWPKPEIGAPGSDKAPKLMRDAGRLEIVLGGLPHEVPQNYALASPVTHVHTECPPTLLIQGDLDPITPIEATRELYRRLVECGNVAVNVVYPRTQHAFDLPLPQITPPTRTALYETERFLALVG